MGKNIITNDVYISSSFARFFIPTNPSLLATKLLDASFLNSLAKLFNNPSDYVYSLKKYPFDVRQFFRCNPWLSSDTPQTLFLGGQSTGITGVEIAYNGGDINESGINQIASIPVLRISDDFKDFEPYTTMKIFIPYFGFYDLPTNEIMGKTLKVYFGVDLLTGLATFWIVVDSVLIMTETKSIGTDVPMGKTNMEEIARNNITASLKAVAGVASLVTGVMTKGSSILIGGGIGLLASSGINAITGNVRTFTKGSIGGNFMSMMSPNSVYIIMTRIKPVIASDFAHTHGKPLGQTRTLSTLTGFTKVGKIHLENLGTATKSEIAEIESLLKTGVIL